MEWSTSYWASRDVTTPSCPATMRRPGHRRSIASRKPTDQNPWASLLRTAAALPRAAVRKVVYRRHSLPLQSMTTSSRAETLITASRNTKIRRRLARMPCSRASQM